MPIFPPRRPSRAVRRRRPLRSAIGPELLEGRRVLAAGPYTFSLVDATGLDGSQYSIQVLGYSAASALTLQPNGTPGELAWSAPASSATNDGTVDGTTITGLSVTGTPSTTGIVTGATVSGPGIPGGTTVTAISTDLQLTQNAASSGTGSILVVQVLSGQVKAGQPTVTALGSTGVSAGTNNLLGATVSVSDGTIGQISGILSGNSATLSANAIGTGGAAFYTTATFDNVVFTAGSPQITGLSSTTNLNVGAAVYRTTAATTIALASDGTAISGTPVTIEVASTTGFSSGGGTILVMTTAGLQAVTYTGTTATSFLGCTGSTGVLSTGGGVYAGSSIGNIQSIAANITLSNAATASGAQLLGVSQEQAFTALGNTLTVASTAGLALGMAVTAATGIPAGTVITQIVSGIEVAISNAATAASGTATFTAQVPAALGSGSTSATLGPRALPNTSPNSTSNVIVGETVTGAGIPSSTTVSAIGAQILISAAALADTTASTVTVGRNNEVQVTTVTVANGSATVTNVGAPANAVANYLATGQLLTVNAFAANQTVSVGGTSGTTIQMNGTSALTGTVDLSFSLIGYSGNLKAGDDKVKSIASTDGLAAGYSVSGPGIPAGTTILSVDNSSQITLSQPVLPDGHGDNVQLTITTPLATGTVTHGSALITSVSDAGLAAKLALVPAGRAQIVLSSGLQATISGITAPTATPAAAAEVTVSAAATASGTGYATFSLPVTAVTVAGSQWISVTGLGATESLSVGDQITGPGIPANATILAILPTITISNASTAPGVTSLTFINAQTGTGTGTHLTGLSSTTGLTVGGPVSGTGIAAGTFIVAINSGTEVTLSAAPAAGSQTVTFGPASGLVNSYRVGSGGAQFSSFGFDPAVQTGGLNGARIYFFVVPNDWPAFATSPSNPGYPTNPAAFPYSYGATGGFMLSQGNNPPNEPTFQSSYPPFAITEVTIDAYNPGTQTGGLVHVDVQTVDGFALPLSLGLKNALQAIVGTVGQPVPANGATRENIIAEYLATFPAPSPYAALVYGSATSIDGQYGGLLNPGNYLYSATSADSPLNTIWDPVLGELFGAVTTTAASSGGQALSSGMTVNVGSTVGFPASGTITITTDNGPQAVPYASKSTTSFTLGTIGGASGNLLTGGQIVYAPNVQLNMQGDDSAYYKGVPQVQNISGTWYAVLEFTGYTDAAMTSAIGNTYQIFSPLTPDPLAPNNATTSGYQVFANDGVFNDDSANVLVAPVTHNGVSPDKVVKGLERDIVSALNRGIGLLAPLDPAGRSGTGGDTSLYWGTETNWYPYSITEDTDANPTHVQNQFSLFMHTATVSGQPIFTQPTTGGPQSTVLTASESGTTVTITTSAAHNLVDGQIATISNVGTGYDGSWKITKLTGTSFSYTATASGLAPQASGDVEGGAVPSAGGLLMNQAYGFAYDEDPVHGPALRQPSVPSKYDPVPADIDTFVITAGAWTASTSAPAVTGVTPTSGPLVGGTTVVITGTDFTGATSVLFGTSAATSFTVDSATQITATSPAHAAGTVDITVTAPGGTSATGSADQFTFVAAPAITGVTPTSGPLAGGTTVVITGTDFTGATSVLFGTSAATSFTVDSATQITATSPAHAAGTVDITVTAPGGTSATGSADQFTFVAAPAITGVTPTSGPLAGGTTVVITGTDFTGATSVLFGTSAATSFTVDSATQITATSPAHAAGTVDITVTAPGGTSTTSSADRFTYVAAPAVTGVSPSSGSTLGGIAVTIVGTDFAGATAVTFGTVAATSFTVDSATQITAIVPAQAAGAVDVRVTSPNGTSATSPADRFTYVAASAPAVAMPISFMTAVGVASKIIWPMKAFVDADSALITATLAVSPTSVGGLVASSAGGVTVTPSGASAASLQFTGTVAALNAYFGSTVGRITYTPSVTSLAARALSLSAQMSNGLVSRTSAALLVRATSPQNPPPAVNASAVVNGRVGQPLVITYAQLVAATGATQTGSRSIQFMLAGLTAGRLEVWTGSRWAVVPTRVGLPLMAPGGQIRWTPPVGASGVRPAFSVKTWDGWRMSGVSQVSVNLAR